MNREPSAERPGPYRDLLASLTHRVRAARGAAARAINQEMVLMYWSIGRDILERQERLGWGTGVIRRLAVDLQAEFPGSRSFSARNLEHMRRLAAAWRDPAIAKQVVSQLPWGHNIMLLQRLDSQRERTWYARKAAQHGWSRAVLAHHIQQDLRGASGRALTNFAETLPTHQTDLAQEMLRDPLQLDFLGLTEHVSERELEAHLVARVRDLLLELGSTTGMGFAFVGCQVPLNVGGRDFRLDLLFFHLRLRCFVVVELKTGEFQPEHAGKLNFYLSAVDDLLRHPDDQPSIGLLLCHDRNRTVAEYALRGTTQPMAVSRYRLTRSLPAELQDALPSVEVLQSRLAGAPR